MSEYAPEYTKRERVFIALKMLVLIITLALISEFWFLDWIVDYAKNANCYIYGDFTGVDVLLYGMFVVLPLSFALMIVLMEGRRSMRIISSGQNPLPGEKVLRPTRYKYGTAALIQPIAMGVIVFLLISLAVASSLRIEKFAAKIEPCVSPLAVATL